MSKNMSMRSVVMALGLLPAVALAGNGPTYQWDEANNPGGPNRCSDNTQCDGARTCSAAGYCQGEARPPFTKVPLYRLWNARITDHLYTHSASERDTRLASGYTSEGVTGLCIDPSEFAYANLVRLYRFYSAGGTEHLYTANADEGNFNPSYQAEGYECYLFSNQPAGTCPLYRLYYPGASANHLYTLSGSEVNSAAGAGYQYEGIVGYMYPASGTACPQ